MFRSLTRALRVTTIRAPTTYVRAFAVVPKNQPKDLVSVIGRELDYEKEESAATKAAVAESTKALSADWKVETGSGSAQVTLTKDNIRVDLDITPVEVESDEYPEGEGGGEEDQEGGQEGYRMMVTMNNDKGKSLRFACTISDALTIHQVQVYDTSKLPSVYSSLGNESTPHYSGPVFDELDSSLQNAFYDYLSSKCVGGHGSPFHSAPFPPVGHSLSPLSPLTLFVLFCSLSHTLLRGITDELCERLADLCAAKEQMEYVTYLEEVQKFVK